MNDPANDSLDFTAEDVLDEPRSIAGGKREVAAPDAVGSGARAVSPFHDLRSRPDASDRPANAIDPKFTDPPSPRPAIHFNSGPSRLIGSGENAMTLHTRVATWLFEGQRFDAQGKLVSIVGARRFAWAVRSIWLLSGNDNPYAAWGLIKIDAELEALRARLDEASERTTARIEALRATGFHLSLLKSAAPQTIALEFQSPYGFAAAALILRFDNYVRQVWTLVYADQLSDEEGRAAIRRMGSPMRAFFSRPIPWARLMLRDTLRTHSRRDFLPAADDSARARVAALTAGLGQLPAEVLAGDQVPRHALGRKRLSPEDLAALRDAALALDPESDPGMEQLL